MELQTNSPSRDWEAVAAVLLVFQLRVAEEVVVVEEFLRLRREEEAAVVEEVHQDQSQHQAVVEVAVVPMTEVKGVEPVRSGVELAAEVCSAEEARGLVETRQGVEVVPVAALLHSD